MPHTRGVSPRFDPGPVRTKRPYRPDRSNLLETTARTLWAYRLELAMVATLAAAWWWLTARYPKPATASILGGALAALLVTPTSRRLLVRLLYGQHLRRRFQVACRLVGLATFDDRTPAIRRWRPVPAGDQLQVRIPDGSEATMLEEAAERLAVVLQAREVRVARDQANAARAELVVVRRDPLANPLADPWPHLHAERLSLWEPIPVGQDEDGAPVTLSLLERHLLIGGEPGAGKSVALSMAVATAALDPAVRLILLDGKWVELASWVPLAEMFVGPDIPRAIEVLSALREEMDGRYRWLLDQGRRKLVHADGRPLLVVVIDELALFLNTGNRKQDDQMAALLHDLVARGRAAGVIVMAATQKPAGNVIPTEIRDLFSLRWAFRCTTPDASDTILGRGWATQGYTAHSIDTAHRGVGFLLAEGNLPRRMRTYYLADQDLADLAARARAARPVPPAPVITLPGCETDAA
ncbi:MAG TPA: FtsK/SpoIIIE domain-containing protein [Actinomycetes bacterium]|jgi:hypothetical protein|nr:FtsK/SpoIIIE domain-containing protein [Actinomycetes bacterium]